MAPDREPTERLSDLLARLYQLHERAGDPYLELWPEDAIGVLQYTRTHHNALPPAQASPARREQVELRLKLVRLLYSLIDTEQLGALDQARPPGGRRGRHLLTLAGVAKVLGLDTPGAVNHRRDRLYAARHQRPRTPWHGRQLMAEREAQTRRRVVEVERARRHHRQVSAAAHGLLEVVHDLVLTEDAQDWLHGLSQLLEEDSLQPDGMSSMAAHLSLALAALGEDAARSPAAADALVCAREALSYRDW
ncbi:MULTISPECIES: hypothetical protein [Nocardiopsis]|uniref:Uncharacterized protein n=1 Tax=Nocardiopsis sinuspersici TaxID=501010 RepID=A0A1V3BV55_9ACTN|nr:MULTISPECIES: hypothetical protein [Nocardiopsis]OOC52431.1 hypothetical protein NOSIN_00100 [Nocardiopsis sinuspersici]